VWEGTKEAATGAREKPGGGGVIPARRGM